MKITRSRLVLSGALALGALAAVAGSVSAAAPADAAPRYSKNPFDGFYHGAVPGSVLGAYSIRIDSHGAVAANNDATYIDGGGQRGSISGKVDAAGNLSVKGIESRSGEWFTAPIIDHRFSLKALVVLEAGNVVGTTTDGVSFVWTRQ